MITSQYDQIAVEFSEQHEVANRDSIARYFSYFDFPLEGLRVIDLGCGNGYDLSRLAKRGAECYGLDSSEAMIHLAKEKNPAGRFVLGSFEKIPFSAEFFDLVISRWALQNCGELALLYAEVARVLKPGGRFIYLTSHPFRQFLEKKYKGKDYFHREPVLTLFFDGQLGEIAPSHTMNEYLCPDFFRLFDLQAYEEGYDSGSEKVDGDTYPSFFIIKSLRKRLPSPNNEKGEK